jgi:predicted enzyme related to lactoylglutathione lyase
MEKSSYQSGTPCWVDFEADDIAKATSFYSELFGWESGGTHPDAGDHRFFVRRGKSVAGISPKQGDGPSRWTTYFSVADADATTARVLVAGGQVVLEPTDVMDEGRTAAYIDSTGASFSVWQPRANRGAGIADEPGAMCWHELGTRNSITATDFYREVFDWVAAVEDMGGQEYTVWKLGDRDVAGMVQMDERWPAEAPSHWLPYFAVADCDAAMAKVSGSGGSTLAGPHDVPPGRFAVLADPEGAPFAIMRLAREDRPVERPAD